MVFDWVALNSRQYRLKVFRSDTASTKYTTLASFGIFTSRNWSRLRASQFLGVSNQTFPDAFSMIRFQTILPARGATCRRNTSRAACKTHTYTHNDRLYVLSAQGSRKDLFRVPRHYSA